MLSILSFEYPKIFILFIDLIVHSIILMLCKQFVIDMYFFVKFSVEWCAASVYHCRQNNRLGLFCWVIKINAYIFQDFHG